ncbi:MAG: VRR-NUC domain-containing protein [Pseudomonadota bacterium]
MPDRFYHQEPPSQAEQGSEEAIQARWLRDAATMCPDVLLAAVPNGGKRTGYARAKVKREGIKKGFPDIIATWPGGVAFIEFKKRGEYPDADQRKILNRLALQGHAVAVVRSSKGAFDFLKLQGAPFAGEWHL